MKRLHAEIMPMIAPTARTPLERKEQSRFIGEIDRIFFVANAARERTTAAVDFSISSGKKRRKRTAF
jgi:hypothetical protein